MEEHIKNIENTIERIDESFIQLKHDFSNYLIGTYWKSNETGKTWKVLDVYRGSGFNGELIIELEDQTKTYNRFIQFLGRRKHPIFYISLKLFIDKIKNKVIELTDYREK